MEKRKREHQGTRTSLLLLYLVFFICITRLKEDKERYNEITLLADPLQECCYESMCLERK